LVALTACGSSTSPASQPDAATLDALSDDVAIPTDAGNRDAGPTDATAPDSADAGAPSDAGLNGPDASAEASTYALSLPQVVNAGGPVLTHPRVVPIVYASDTMAAQIQQFVTALAGSTYWGEVTAEYGGGALTVLPMITLMDPPPATITDPQIQTLISTLMAAGADGGPPSDGQTIYAYFPPASVTVYLDEGVGLQAVSCVNFGGYHQWMGASQGPSTPYAVIGRCNGYLNEFGLDFVTAAASHEFVEATTDPYGTAFIDANLAGSGWGITAGGGEVGDLCKLDPTSEFTPSDLGFKVQRIWSNKAAAGGHDPCVPPPPGDAYVLGVPDVAPTTIYPGQQVIGIAVAPGSSTTVDVHFYSDGPVSGPFTLSASEPTVPQLLDPAHQLSFSFDQTQGQDGDVAHLTVTRAPPAEAGLVPPAPFVITATLGSVQHWYWGVVGD
jgi:hypothetical protein